MKEAADRLLFVPDQRFLRGEERDGPRVLLRDASDTAAPPRKAPGLSSETVVRVLRWVEEHTATLPALMRATARAQAPTLVSWAASLGDLAHKLEHAVAPHQPERVEFRGLTPKEVALLDALCRDRGWPLQKGVPGIAEIKMASRAKVRKAKRRTRRLWHAGSAQLGRAREGRARAKKALVIVSFQPNSTRSVLPFVRELKPREPRPHFLLRADDQVSQNEVREAGYTSELLETSFKLGDVRAAQQTAKAIMRELAPELTGLLEAMALPSWAQSGQVLEVLSKQLQDKLAGTCVMTLGVERVLSAVEPEAVVFSTNRAMMNELLAPRAERTRRIFFLQGLIPDNPPVFASLDVDCAIVGSELDRPYVERCGVPPERLHVTGYPDYSHYLQLDRQECRKWFGGVVPEFQGQPLVVFTSQYTTEVFPEWARHHHLCVLAETARALPGYLFVVKAHPRHETIHPETRRSFPDNLIVAPPCDTDKTLKAADAAVTYWSTTALEAVLLDTPLVQLNATGLPDFLHITQKMGREPARSSAELTKMLRELVDDQQALAAYAEDREQFLARYRLGNDVHASKLAAERVDLCVDSGQSAE